MAVASGSIQYRPEIDGLRAISVVLVVLFHAGFPAFPGGYFGVDIFFVISGYLITKLLVHELAATGTIDLPAFWARRVRRILPAAATVLCLSLIAASLILPPLEVTQAASDLKAAALYYANWRFAETAQNYFAQSKGSLFLNYWSLAIEEQFYVAWPVLIVLVCRLANKVSGPIPAEKTVLHLAAAIVIASFAYCLWLSSYSTSAAFYGTFSRAWELGLGAVLAASRPTIARSASATLTILGLLAIAGVAVLVPGGGAHPGLITLLPTVGAAAIIAANAAETVPNPASRLLRSRAMVFVGKLSYSLYLWHWPVFFLGRANLVTTTWTRDMLLVLVSFCLAFLTHVLIENPVRFAGRLVISSRVSILFGAALSVFAASFAVVAQATFAKPIIILSDGKRFDALYVLDQSAQIYRDGCHLDLLTTAYKPCVYGDVKGVRKALLVGDSVAAAWFPALQIATAAQHWKLIARTKSMCSPAVIEERAPQLGRSYEECNTWRNAVLQEAARERPDIIFVAGASMPPLRKADLAVQAAEAAYTKGEADLVRHLIETTDADIVFLRMPALDYNPIGCLLAHPRAEHACTTNLEEATKRSPFPRGNYKGKRRTRVVDLGLDICPRGQCQAYRNGQIIMSDRVHLTPMFARTVAAPFERILANHKSGAVPDDMRETRSR